MHNYSLVYRKHCDWTLKKAQRYLKKKRYAVLLNGFKDALILLCTVDLFKWWDSSVIAVRKCLKIARYAGMVLCEQMLYLG